MSTDEFHIRDLVRDVCTSSTIADPHSLAAEVLRRIGPKDARAALEQVLPTFVRVAISQHRGTTAAASGPDGPPSVRSWKVSGVRESWRRMLRDRISVGDTQWKFLGECTAEDLAYAEQVRRIHAAQNLAAAERFAGLRELLEQHGVATVADLPDDTLGHALGEAA